MCTHNCACTDPTHIHHIAVETCPHCGAYVMAGIGTCAGCGKDIVVQAGATAEVQNDAHAVPAT